MGIRTRGWQLKGRHWVLREMLLRVCTGKNRRDAHFARNHKKKFLTLHFKHELK